ncbi:MAG: hypothetical protein SV375_15370 [Thermodesulfobacteriota bacterium]|nr:hypothetical protein [Thermodesulfobacteriota bacterium]
MLDLAAEIRTEIDVPFIAASRLSTGAFADKAISEGNKEFIGLGRLLCAPIHHGRKRSTMAGRPTLSLAIQNVAMLAYRWL